MKKLIMTLLIILIEKELKRYYGSIKNKTKLS